MGEILMNHLMFADDICVFCPSVCGLESILNVCQAYAESHEIIFNCHKTIRMTFKAKTAKSAVIPIAVARYTKSKICCPLQNFGAVRDIELSDDKNIQRQLWYQKLIFPNVRTHWKNVLFRFFCTSMYVSQLCCDFRKAYIHKLRVAYI